jgi:hypothetical protein
MSDLARLQEALVAADRAGDTNAATLFANEIRRLQSPAPAPAASQPPATPQAAPQAPQAPAPRTNMEQLGLGTRATAQGLLGLPGLVYDVAAIPQNLLSNVPGLEWMRAKPAAQQVSEAATAVGLPEPRDAGERIMGAAIQGAAGVPTGYGLGGVVRQQAGAAGQRLADVLQAAPAQQAVMGATGGVGSQAAQEAVGPETSPTAKAVAGVAGGLAGAAVPAAVSGLARRTFGTVAPAPGVPTAEETKQAAQRAYKAADEAGVIFTPGAAKRLREDIAEQLSDFGYNPGNQPGTANVLKEIDRIQDNVFAFKELENIRKQALKVGGPMNESDRVAARKIVNAIDDLVKSPRVGTSIFDNDVIAGPVAQAAGIKTDVATASKMISEARAAWSRLMKHGEIADAIERAQANAATAGSGANLENTMRQALKSVMLNKEATRGFTPDEMKALKSAVEGDLIQNTLRLFGKAAPTGVVSGILSGGGGAAVLGPAGAVAVPAVGYLSKRAADQMEREKAQRLMDIILSGGRAATTPSASQPRGNIPALINILQQGISP